MKRIAALAGATLFAMMSAGCNQTANTHDADVQAIKDVETQWNQDYVAKDLDKLAGHYADAAVLMAPGEAATVGKDAIRNALKQMVSDPTKPLKFQATKVDTSSSGDMGYSHGTYTLTLTDPQSKQLINDHGSYVTVYRKGADGTWKAVSDIASSAVPPPAPAPAPAAKKH
jgi:uncharacterized protein (TIGR02246 family)